MSAEHQEHIVTQISEESSSSIATEAVSPLVNLGYDPGFTLNHVLLGTNGRPHAIETFRNLGFTIHSLGEHSATGSHNAMIDLPRPGGTYIELISMAPTFYGSVVGLIGASPGFSKFLSKVSLNALDSRLLLGAPALRDRGLADYAVWPSPETNVEDLQRSSDGFFSNTFAFPQDQTASTGQMMHFTLCIPREKDCPFVVRDDTVRQIPPESMVHPNGALGIKRLVVLVDDLQGAAQRLISHFGAVREYDGDAPLDFVPPKFPRYHHETQTWEITPELWIDHTDRVDLLLGNGAYRTQLCLVSRHSGNHELDHYLHRLIEERSSHPLLIELWCSAPEDRFLDPALAYGTLIRLVPDQHPQ